MKALITLNVEWISKPRTDLLYFVNLNGEETEITDPKSQLFLWDPHPYRFVCDLIITAERKRSILSRDKMSNLVLSKATENFSRKLNHKWGYKPDNLVLSEYLKITYIECSVSGFTIPQWNPIVKSSPVLYIDCTDPDDVSSLSLYFQSFNIDQIVLANKNNKEGVLQLEIKHVTFFQYDKDDKGMLVYYGSNWLSSVPKLEEDSAKSESDDEESSSEDLDDKKKIKLIDNYLV